MSKCIIVSLGQDIEQLFLQCECWNMRPIHLWCSCTIQLKLEVKALWGPLLATKKNWPDIDRIAPFIHLAPLSVFPRRCNPDSYTDCLIRVMANWTRGVFEWWAAVFFFFFLALLSEEEGACRFDGILQHIILHFPSATSLGSSWVFLHLTSGNIRLHLWYALYNI